MLIGVPKEIKNHEYRVAITPSGVVDFVKNNHQVIIEKDAGIGSAITNEEYEKAGAKIINSAHEIWQKSEMILKVKEPIKEEYSRLKKIKSFLHIYILRLLKNAQMLLLSHK